MMLDDRLKSSPPRRWVKFCGFKTPGQAEEAIACGADALGFNFWPRSKRYLPMEQAESWLPSLKGRVLRIGLFVNADQREVHQAFASHLIDAAQFHGDESIAYCLHFHDLGLPFIKAIGVRDEEQIATLDQWRTPHVLLDAWQPDSYGGGGRSFNWDLAKKAAEQYPQLNLILSGGLDARNIGQALRSSGLTSVDVASGIESSPGVKEAEKMRAFAEAVHAV